MSAPAAANSTAMARPIPCCAPVTRTTFPVHCIISLQRAAVLDQRLYLQRLYLVCQNRAQRASPRRCRQAASGANLTLGTRETLTRLAVLGTLSRDAGE